MKQIIFIAVLIFSTACAGDGQAQDMGHGEQPLVHRAQNGHGNQRGHITHGHGTKVPGHGQWNVPQQAPAPGTTVGTISPHSGPSSGKLRFKDPNGLWMDAPAVDIHYDVRVAGLLAQMEITQNFYNPSQDTVEAVYTYPLPAGGAVDGLTIVVGQRLVVGEIHPKEKAKAIYEGARLAGKRAALVEQKKKNVFSTKVSAISPNEAVKIVIRFQTQIDYESGVFAMTLPTTITPRYLPGAVNIVGIPTEGFATGQEDGNNPFDVSPPMAPRGQGPTVSMAVQLVSGLTIEYIGSSTHDLTVDSKADGHHIRLSADTVLADRDVKLTWSPPLSDAPTAALFHDEVEGEKYAMMMVLPALQNAKTLPREVTFIVDESGSMGGESIKQARAAVYRGLRSLKTEDTFNIIAFDDGMRPLFDAPRPVNQTHIKEATDFVHTIEADGGTDMAPALSRALDPTPVPGRVGQVLFITDGSIGNEQTLLKLIQDRLDTRRLFPIAIGSAPNSGFMREAARFGRGTFTAIAQVNEVEEKMAVLIAKLENPSLTQIEVVAPGADIYPKRMPDLYLGEPMTFAAKLTGKEDSIMLHGRLRDEDWEMKLPLEGGGSQAGVYKNWAKRIIDHQLDSRSFGTPEDEVRKRVVALAMKFHMVTPYTSLVAVDKIKKPVDEPSLSRQIANAGPHGSNYMGNLPQGSTPAPLLLLLSLLSGLGSVFFGRRSWAS